MKKRRITPRAIILFIILICIIGGASFLVIKDRLRPEVAFLNIDPSAISVTLENQVMTVTPAPKKINNVLYVPYSLVKYYIHPDVFLDVDEELFTYTTIDQVYRIKANTDTITINDKEATLKVPFVFDKTMYIPVAFVEKFFNVAVGYNEKYNRMTIDYTDKEYGYGYAKRNAKVYTGMDVKGDIAIRIDKEAKVMVYAEENVIEGFVKVRTQEGILGYMRMKDLGELSTTIKEENKTKVAVTENTEPVRLVWHQVFNQTANGNVSKSFLNTKGLNVVSPTWFSITKDGELKSIANKAYVDYAHNRGYKVWALVDNGFSNAITEKVVGTSEARSKLIKELLDYAKEYSLDGINIDFESVGKETGPYYVQFMKEFAVASRLAGITSSVDMYVPSAWTAHYNRKELGAYVDYVIVMGYDEHWSGSKTAGSVSSIDFFQRGLDKTVEDVPASKVIMGLPFYTRLWIEEEKDGKIELSSKALGMEAAEDFVSRNGLTKKWLEDIGQYYVELTVNNKTYKMWLEDQASIGLRLERIKEANIGGMAAWKKNLETDNIWDLVEKAFIITP